MHTFNPFNVCCLHAVGESSGKASRSLATYTPGPAGMAYAQDASTSAVSDIARAKMVRCNSLLCTRNTLSVRLLPCAQGM